MKTKKTKKTKKAKTSNPKRWSWIIGICWFSLLAITGIAPVTHAQENTVWSQSFTSFNGNDLNRVNNIRLAAAAFEQRVVLPGQGVSFNAVVGPRTAARGYRQAPVIIQRQLVLDTGGGVCQVASTLYNAVLKAGLAVVERQRHSLPVKYVPPGLDATVLYGSIDFKFYNDTDSLITLDTVLTDNTLTVLVLGEASGKPQVTINADVQEYLEPPIMQTLDSNLPLGQAVVEREGVTGYRTRVERVTTWGQQSWYELISRDVYPPVERVIRVGNGPGS